MCHHLYNGTDEQVDARCPYGTDAFTEAKPAQFGHGKIDAKRGLEMVLNAGTDIKSLSEEQRNGTDIMYDLQGRPCSQPHAKGIYIKSGKKVIIK